MLDQMFQMLMLLINNKKTKITDLAECLGVSTKTVTRYLDALTLQGVPILTEKGRNGGVSLGQEFVLPRNFFSIEELTAIKTALLQCNGDKAQNTNIALKLNSVTKQFDLADESKIINVQSHGFNGFINNKISEISKAIKDRCSLQIRYYARDGEYSTRKIIPLNFLVKDGDWYIYCYCLLRKQYRTFKLTRISHIIKDSKHDFNTIDYPKYWNLMGDDSIELKLKVTPKGRFMIIDWLGIEQLKATQNIDETITITINYSVDLIYKLLSFGDKIEILAPQSIIDEYNNVVKNISQKYL